MMSFLLRIVMVVAAATALSGGVAQDDGDLGWPREFMHDGHLVVMYQPQLESFNGDRLTGRSAVSVVPEGKSEPVFGAVWFEAFVETDRDERLVTIVSVSVPRVRFPNITEEQAAQFSAILESEIATWDMVVSLDRILTGLELAERERLASDNLSVEPPTILFAEEPSLLVTIDGAAVLHEIEDTGLQRVVNTPFVIAFDPEGRAYYLYAGDEVWFSAADAMGPWALSQRTPEKVASLVPPDTVPPDPEAEEEAEIDFDIAELRIIVASEPTELIVFDGRPEFTPIDGTDLLYVANTEADVFMDIGSQQYFIVLAGRWYTSGSLEGPWSFAASDSLPEDFAGIPPESARGSVLTYVAGTDQALDAVLDTEIPQTAAITRDATIEVEYDGEPKFEPIEGTSMEYAVNTDHSVIRAGSKYYACYEAVWYESDSAAGTYTVAVEIPEEIKDIPPDSPVYNTRYVFIYDYTPETVYTGYTPGYSGSYVYHTTVVYGTGYYYYPWVSPYYYYPRPVTYGFRVHYNPWYGWSFGFGFSYGPFHFGFYSRPPYWGYPGGYWGPAGYRYGYHRGYHRGYGAGYRAGYRAAQGQPNIYNRQGNAARNVDRATARAQLSQRRNAPTQAVQRPEARPAQAAERNRAAPGRDNNVFADRDGNVYRRNEDGSWQQRDRDGWRPADRSAVQGQQPTTRQQPTMRQQPTTRPQPTAPATMPNRSGDMSREFQNRQRGTQRTQSFQRSRPAPRTGGVRGRR